MILSSPSRLYLSFLIRSFGPLLQDLILVLLQVNSEQRPTAAQLLRVQSMQPHISSYLNRIKPSQGKVGSDSCTSESSKSVTNSDKDSTSEMSKESSLSSKDGSAEKTRRTVRGPCRNLNFSNRSKYRPRASSASCERKPYLRPNNYTGRRQTIAGTRDLNRSRSCDEERSSSLLSELQDFSNTSDENRPPSGSRRSGPRKAKKGESIVSDSQLIKSGTSIVSVISSTGKSSSNDMQVSYLSSVSQKNRSKYSLVRRRPGSGRGRGITTATSSVLATNSSKRSTGSLASVSSVTSSVSGAAIAFKKKRADKLPHSRKATTRPSTLTHQDDSSVSRNAIPKRSRIAHNRSKSCSSVTVVEPEINPSTFSAVAPHSPPLIVSYDEQTTLPVTNNDAPLNGDRQEKSNTGVEGNVPSFTKPCSTSSKTGHDNDASCLRPEFHRSISDLSMQSSKAYCEANIGLDLLRNRSRSLRCSESAREKIVNRLRAATHRKLSELKGNKGSVDEEKMKPKSVGGDDSVFIHKVYFYVCSFQ